MKYILHLFCLLFLLPLNAQTEKEKSVIVSKSNLIALEQLKNKFNLEFENRQNRIKLFLESNPEILVKFNDNGVDKEIYDIESDGSILYMETTNLESSVTASTNKIYNGGSLGLNLQGQNMTAAVWDSGQVRDTHQEFPDYRVTPLDYTTPHSNHATHVMGTVLASGTSPSARGLAFEANGLSYDWNNDYSEMASAAAGGLLVSNHSYWIGSSLSEWILGAYDYRAQGMDQLTYAAPYYLPVVSAGNDRNNTSNPILNTHMQNKFGYDLIRGMNNAKNSLTVGAVNNVTNYIDQASVQMSSFSSWGPTDDGRIKPEIVAKGVSVFSPIGTSDTSYDVYQGTSMASPAVTGVCLLLQQDYNNLFSSYMRSSTLKGLILHSAKEAGLSVGPDYEYGWGLIDAAGAASIMTSKNSNTARIDEILLTNGSTYTTTVVLSSVSDLKASISWTDKASSSVNSGVVDPSTSYLVNDLDIKVVKLSSTYYPWSLSKSSPYSSATNIAPNNVDVFERVDINNAIGNYTITVSHKGTLDPGGQYFSLIVSGANNVLSNNDHSSLNNEFFIYPNPTNNVINIQTELESANVQIVDVLGNVVYSNNLVEKSIDVSSLASGLYIYKINYDNNIIVRKFMKK